MPTWLIVTILVSVVGGVAFAATRPSFIVGLVMEIINRFVKWVIGIFKANFGFGGIFKYTPPKDEAEAKERARKKALKDMSRK